MAGCIFCRIVAGELPAEVVTRTEHTVAFRDLDPKSPTHVLVVPVDHVAHAGDLDPEHGDMLAELFTTASAVAASEGIAGSGYRLVFNIGDDAGNTVPHLHLHVLGGRPMAWPPG